MPRDLSDPTSVRDVIGRSRLIQGYDLEHLAPSEFRSYLWTRIVSPVLLGILESLILPHPNLSTAHWELTPVRTSDLEQRKCTQCLPLAIPEDR